MSTEQQAWPWEQADTAGKRLKLLRQSFDLSAAAAAFACGIDDQTWRNYERGTHKIPVERLQAIVERFEGRAERTRDLAGWLTLGGQMPPLPEPTFPFSKTTGSDLTTRSADKSTAKRASDGKSSRRLRDTPSYVSHYALLSTIGATTSAADAISATAAA